MPRTVFLTERLLTEVTKELQDLRAPPGDEVPYTAHVLPESPLPGCTESFRKACAQPWHNRLNERLVWRPRLAAAVARAVDLVLDRNVESIGVAAVYDPRGAWTQLAIAMTLADLRSGKEIGHARAQHLAARLFGFFTKEAAAQALSLWSAPTYLAWMASVIQRTGGVCLWGLCGDPKHEHFLIGFPRGVEEADRTLIKLAKQYPFDRPVLKSLVRILRSCRREAPVLAMDLTSWCESFGSLNAGWMPWEVTSDLTGRPASEDDTNQGEAMELARLADESSGGLASFIKSCGGGSIPQVRRVLRWPEEEILPRVLKTKHYLDLPRWDSIRLMPSAPETPYEAVLMSAAAYD